jgi:exodeoxyribonuclease V alpha subunit
MSLSVHLSGLIERVTFHNPENGFCVLKVKIKEEKDLTCVIGNLALVSAGEWFQAEGAWFQDKQFGRQFKASAMKTQSPTNVHGIEKYLASGIIKGIREITAKKLIKAFGKRVFEVLDSQPEALTTVAGLSEKQAARILQSWGSHRSLRALIELLSQHGITPTQALKIHKRYDDEAVARIEENPYCLVTDIRGIGFATADRIAQSMGMDLNSPLRARAGITYVLSEAQDDGHCGLPTPELLEKAHKLLDIYFDIIEEALDSEITQKRVMRGTIQEQECIFPVRLYQSEKSISHLLKTLAEGPLPWVSLNVEESCQEISSQHKIQLSPTQEEAFRKALSSKVMIITGGPGVGKTTLMRSLLAVLSKAGTRIILGAPTGRAAKRLSEVTGMPAKTLHRILEINPTEGAFGRTLEKPLECDLVVVDEVSMVDVPLFNSLLKAIPPNAALLLVGDSDQLPSVGPGQVLGDMIRSGFIPAVHLTEVFRQASESKIISVAHNINQGIFPQLQGHGRDSDFFFIEAPDPAQALEQIVDIATRRLPQNLKLCPLNDIQILSPMGRGDVGTRSLNERLQKVLNPPHDHSLKRNGMIFSAMDKVMQIKNNYDKDVYNGDIGIVKSINHDAEEMLIEFDGRTVEYDFSELDEIILSYAITIHKSQGSEYPAVIIPLVSDHYVMLQKNLIYTAITRGKSLVIVVGDKRALSLAVQNNRARKRWSMLGERLKQFCA